MTLLEAVILGIVQGLTEPLPVSSSGHLVIVPAMLPGFTQPGIFFDLVLHLGTLAGIVFFLRREIAAILASLIPGLFPAAFSHAEVAQNQASGRKMALLIVIATGVTGLIGVLFKDRIERLFESVEITAGMLLVTGLLLFISDRVKHAKRRDMNWKDGILLGLVQAAALIPGISRSGSTIAFGIFLGVERRTAARFSFLISIPAILGAVLLKAGEAAQMAAGDLPALAAGFGSAAITGFLALKLLFAVIQRTGLGVFAYYCWAVGIAALIARGMQA